MSVCQIDAALEQVEMQGRIKNCVHLRSTVAGQVEAGWGSGAAGTNDEARACAKRHRWANTVEVQIACLQLGVHRQKQAAKH